VADQVVVRSEGDVRRARRAHPEATVLLGAPAATLPVRCIGAARPRERRFTRSTRSTRSTTSGTDPGDSDEAGSSRAVTPLGVAA
jgi:hypothetical protein